LLCRCPEGIVAEKEMNNLQKALITGSY
jgi:hypothetical protein